ncbi:MAG TPA: 50S ribosomal protein L11 methyltransferase [Gemmatimonadales bacterium]|nr:50S ribosomal protein L11 methyltransferase [Gemmatimonadales bacterium]
MSWWAVDVRTDPARREWLGAWLVARTGQAVEERDDGTIVTFAADEARADELLAALDLELTAEGLGYSAERRLLDEVDWSTRWKEGLGPRQFGRLTVAPTWAAEAADGPVVVQLDPENAFGSGEHGSTRAALTLLERLLHPGDRVLDLGSGSGILAIAAACLGAAWAVGVEVDAEANAVALRNAERNGVARLTGFLDGDAADLAPLLGPADLVLSNILRTANAGLLPAIALALRPGGVAIFSGMEEAEAGLFRPLLPEAGLRVIGETVDAGWWAVAARRG